MSTKQYEVSSKNSVPKIEFVNVQMLTIHLKQTNKQNTFKIILKTTVAMSKKIQKPMESVKL